MKILYAIQGTGNGHLSRAEDIYPELCKYGEVDVLVSGIQADVQPNFPFKYKFYGISFIFGKKGGVSVGATLRSLRPLQFLKDVRSLQVEEYDIVINDFEPVSAWACKIMGVPCYSLSHQFAVINPQAPKPQKTDRFARWILKNYAPVKSGVGFHFLAYHPDIFTPVVRHSVRQLSESKKGHYTVYLPAYSDEQIVNFCGQFPEVKWCVFSKHAKRYTEEGNTIIQPINSEAYLQSIASANGVLCGAGFEGPAELLYLRKKLMVIPMYNQYEQQCNAEALRRMGVRVITGLEKKYYATVSKWLSTEEIIPVHFPHTATRAVEAIIKKAGKSYIKKDI